jgi:hypothetical protein
MHADVAYAAGASGQGILVADIDTGVDPTRPDLAGAVSPLSTDIISGRNTPVGTDPHADFVAGVLASRFNNFGTIGVAYNSTVLSIRADTGTGADEGFNDSDIANGIAYAIANHARVINLSLGATTPSSGSLQRALANAVAAGIVVTVSAGNESNPSPDWPAEYAVDPRYSGFVVAVGALDTTGALASFSNQAGTAANGYLVAPGVNLITDCSSTSCERVSGTSFAAPQVAGAIALLLQAFPNLTAQQALAILFQSADDLGVAGTDAVFGRGELDLTKAFQPAGTMSVPMSASSSLVVNNPNLAGGAGMQTSTTGPAFGSSVSSSRVLTTVGYDAYHRLYTVNLAAAYQRAPVLGLIAPDPALHQTQSSTTGPDGSTLSFADGGMIAPSPDLPLDRTFQGNADPGYTQVAAGFGGLTLMAWHGQGGVQPDFGEARDAFQQIAGPDQVGAARFQLGGASLIAEGGTSQRLPPLATTPQKGPSYARFGADFSGAGYQAHIGVGSLTEPLGPLGSALSGAFAAPALTRFATVGGEAYLGRSTLYGEASMGRTNFSGTLLQLEGSISSSWRLGVVSPCAGVWRGCSNVGLEIAQPLRIESGDAVATLADVPAQYFDPLTFSQRRVGLAPSGRELDLRLFADKRLGDFGLLRLEATAASDEGNVAGAPVGLGFLASWRSQF